MIERKFIQAKLKKLELKELLAKELSDSGFSHAEVRKTPLGTRVVVYTSSPGRVIGQKGSSINELTKRLKESGLENPIIEVEEIKRPELDPKLMAEYIARGLERGFSFKSVAHRALDRIKKAGARGAQVRLSGLVISKRKSSWPFQFGQVKYTGEQAKRLVREGKAVAHTKPGELGVKVKIVPPEEEYETEGIEEAE